MQRNIASVALGLPVAFVLGSLAYSTPLPSTSQEPGSDVSRVVAVVDVSKVRQGYPRAKAFDEAWKAEQAGVDRILQQGAQELEKLKLELNGWDPFTKEWIVARQRLSGTEAGLKVLRDTEEQRLVIDRFKNHEEIYHDIDRAITKLAEKRNLQLVMRVTSKIPDTAPLDSRVDMWRAKTVFYHHDRLDLTEDVIKYLKSPEFTGNDTAPPGSGK